MIAIRSSAFILALVLTAAGCGGSAEGSIPSDAVAIAASNDLGPGPQRLLVGIGLDDGTRIGSPDDAVSLEVAPLEDPASVQTVPATFVWILEPVVGLYRADVVFDRAGPWQVVVTPEGGRGLEPALFNVFEDTFTPDVGEAAPLPPTPTLDDLPIEELTTDDDPDLRFYETSLEDSVAAGLPTVVVFSTPAYCQTSACGPLLDIVKSAAADHPDVTFIHVEVFTGLTEPDFAPDAQHLAPAVTEQWFNLPSEPWVFVIDQDGLISARFEGVMDSSELEAALGKISL